MFSRCVMSCVPRDNTWGNWLFNANKLLVICLHYVKWTVNELNWWGLQRAVNLNNVLEVPRFGVWCPWGTSPVLEPHDDFSCYSSSRETNIAMDAQDLPRQNSQELSGRAGVERGAESFPCRRRGSMREASDTGRPHDGILVRCVGHDRRTRAASVCPSVRLSVVPNLVPSPGLLPGRHTQGWFRGSPPTRCLLDPRFEKRVIPLAFTQSSSGMGREGFGVMADPITAQGSSRCWVRCSKVGTSGCTQCCTGAWQVLAHLWAWCP